LVKRGGFHLRLLDRNTHVAAISAFATVALIFADTALSADASIFAPLARTLTVTALLALPAALAPRLAGQIFLIDTKLVLEVQRRARCLARLSWEAGWRHWLLRRTSSLSFTLGMSARLSGFGGLGGEGGARSYSVGKRPLTMNFFGFNFITSSLERVVVVFIVLSASVTTIESAGELYVPVRAIDLPG
jgi:hypothetical protein